MAPAGAEHLKAPLLYTAGVLGIVAVAGALSGPLAQGRFAPILPFGLAAMGVIFALALAQPLLLFGVGFALFGVVRTEPAPVDVVFAILILVTVMSGRVSPRIPASIEVLIGLTAFVTLLSSVNAVDTRRAIQYGFVSLYLLGLGVWLTWVFRDAKATRLAIKAYIGVAVVSSVLVLLALYVGLPGGNLLLYDPSRGKGLFKDPNVYAAFVVPAAVIALEEIGRPRLFHWGRVKAVALFAILAAGVVIAFSRAAWLNLALGCITVLAVALFRRGGVRVAARSLIGLLVAGVAGLALLSATGSIDFLKQRSKLEAYDQQRFGAQDSALSRIGEHVLGHGPGQVERTLDLSTHSLYARAAFEQGAPGLILLLLLLGATLYYAVRLARADREIHGIGSGALLGIWIGLIANGTFIDAIHWRHLYVFAALIWCCAAAPPTGTNAKGLEPPAPTNYGEQPDESKVSKLQQTSPEHIAEHVESPESMPARSRLRARTQLRYGLSRALVVLIVANVVLSFDGGSQGENLALSVIAAAVYLPCLIWASSSARAMPLAFGVWIVAALGAATGLVALSAVAYWVDKYSLREVVLIALFTFLSTGLWDEFIRRAATAPLRVIIIGGGGELVSELVADMERHPDGAGFRVVGVAVQSVTPDLAERSFRIVTADDLESLVADVEPDLIVVAVDQGRPAVFARLLAIAYTEEFNVLGLPEFYEVAFGRLPVRSLTSAWFMSTLHFYNRPYNQLAKRSFDIVASILGVIVAAPILLIAALIVKRTPGPLLYRQKRLGEHGRVFEILKLRSMKVDAEADGTAVFAAEDDPRIIPGGRLLRRLRIDEIPQLWNVLHGEMSMVGPRPERPEFLNLLAEQVPHWTQRNLLKPGITGWAQVRAGYASDSLGAEEKLSYDLWYLRHRSLMLDSIICLKTIGTVLTASGSR